MSINCNYCKRTFKSLSSMWQHIGVAHRKIDLMLDENCSEKEVYVLNILHQGYKVFRFPEHLRGKEDYEVINYAYQKQYGLITHDKGCEKRANKRLSQVFLI